MKGYEKLSFKHFRGPLIKKLKNVSNIRVLLLSNSENREHLAPIVQTVDSAIRRKNLYPVDI